MSKVRVPFITRHPLLVAVAGALVLLLGLALAVLLWPSSGAPPPGGTSPTATLATPVTTATAHRGTITRTVSTVGVIQAHSETQLSARAPARVLAVRVHEGDRVRRGQLLARLDDREARAALDSALAGVRAAEAALAKARGGAALRGSELETNVTTAAAAVTAARARLEQARGAARSAVAEATAELRRAQAGLESARANLAAATRGARPAQRRQAEAAVTQAEAGARAAHRALEEAQFLYDRGGLTRAQLEEARTADVTARAQLDAARASLEQAIQGASPEERQAAEAAVRQAEAGVDAARAGVRRARLAREDVAAAEAQLRQAEAGLKAARAARAARGVAQQDVAAAAAALEQARIQWKQAREQVAATRLVSPVNGVVTLRAADPGQIAQPGQPLVAVASGPRTYVTPVSVTTVSLLRPGQPVELTSEAAPGRRFHALLREVPSVPEPDGRTYTVRAPLVGAGLPPGSRARGLVQVARAVGAVLVPTTALHQTPEGAVVWVARQGRAERRPVHVGIETDAVVRILSGVAPGEAVIVSGAEALRPGAAVDTGQRSEGFRPPSASFSFSSVHFRARERGPNPGAQRPWA